MDEALKAMEERLSAQINAAADRVYAETFHDVKVLLENTVSKQLQLLVEGQQTILQTLAPKDRVEALEDEIVFLKQVIRAMSQDIAELKKAQ